MQTAQGETYKLDSDALFSAQKQNKTGTWKTRDFVRFWPIRHQPGPREPDPAARAAVRFWARPLSPRARRSRRCPPTRPAPRRPSRTRGGRHGPGWPFPRARARYLSGCCAGVPPATHTHTHLRAGQGTPRWSPARTRALPSPRRRSFPSRPARPLPRGPTSVQSLPRARVRSRDGIRCQLRCQTPPVGGGEASPDLLLSASHHPRPSWAQERGAPGRRLKGALPALAGERRSGSHLNSAGSGRQGRRGVGGRAPTHRTALLLGPRPRPGRG